MQGCPCSDLCLVFAVQREGFQPVDRDFQSGLVKVFLRLPPPPLVDVSGDSFTKVFAGLPVPNLPNRMLFEPVTCLFEPSTALVNYSIIQSGLLFSNSPWA